MSMYMCVLTEARCQQHSATQLQYKNYMYLKKSVQANASTSSDVTSSLPAVCCFVQALQLY